MGVGSGLHAEIHLLCEKKSFSYFSLAFLPPLWLFCTASNTELISVRNTGASILKSFTFTVEILS